MQVGGVGNVLSAGLAGIQKGQQQVAEAAQQVASANTDRPVGESPDITRALMQEKEGQRQVEASARVVESGNETLGSLIDISV